MLANLLPAAALAQGRAIGRPMPRDPYAGHVAEASQRFGVPAAWIKAVMRAESAGDTRAVSRKGAMGLMQIMPATWTALSARYALGADPFDVRANILAGTAYLREMVDRYGDFAAALAAYNAGPGRVDAHLIDGRALPAETRTYVARILPDAVGEHALLPLSAAPADRSTWRNAALFIERGDARATAGDATNVPPATGTPIAGERARELTVSAHSQRADRSGFGLFVERYEGAGR
ncbi:lytic transglycosylase domain-containing protein [Sphingomonas lycopersici]|nr:lytic transglycosylase domain-containing protein [Sphingomonas lycopersici]